MINPNTPKPLALIKMRQSKPTIKFWVLGTSKLLKPKVWVGTAVGHGVKVGATTTAGNGVGVAVTTTYRGVGVASAAANAADESGNIGKPPFTSTPCATVTGIVFVSVAVTVGS